MRRFLFLLGSWFLLSSASAQDLTGTWTGTEDGNYMRLVVVKVDNKYVGYTYDTDQNGGYCRANFEGSYDAVRKKLLGGGTSMIRMRLSHVLCDYDLSFTSGGGTDKLAGPARTKGSDDNSFSALASIELRRVTRNVDTTPYMRQLIAQAAPPRRTLPPAARPTTPRPAPPAVTARPRPTTPPATPAARPTAPANQPVRNPRPADSIAARKPEEKPQAPAPTAAPPRRPVMPLLALRNSRRNTLVQEIETSSPTVTVRVFDSGVPDGDTVSVLHNNEVIFNHKLVAVQAFTFELRLDEGDPLHEITLLAHNLGTIPPNTATVIIDAGDQRYRLTASTDLGTNAVIRLRYKKP